MANILSAKKRARQNLKRRARNQQRVSRLRTFVRHCEQAIDAKETDKAEASFREATRELHRAAQSGLIRKTTASRKVSRLSKRVKMLAS